MRNIIMAVALAATLALGACGKPAEKQVPSKAVATAPQKAPKVEKQTAEPVSNAEVLACTNATVAANNIKNPRKMPIGASFKLICADGVQDSLRAPKNGVHDTIWASARYHLQSVANTNATNAAQKVANDNFAAKQKAELATKARIDTAVAKAKTDAKKAQSSRDGIWALVIVLALIVGILVGRFLRPRTVRRSPPVQPHVDEAPAAVDQPVAERGEEPAAEAPPIARAAPRRHAAPVSV